MMFEPDVVPDYNPHAHIGPPVLRELQSTLGRPGLAVRLWMLATWVMLVVFIFGLPLWSRFFNDTLGFGARLCRANAADIVCMNDPDSQELARRLGRIREDGTLWGCFCEEGVFADWACTQNAKYFSVSHFVSTGPGTGALAFFSAFPILFIWLYGGANTTLAANFLEGSGVQRQCYVNALTVTQTAFQLFYGAFQFASMCVFPTVHFTVVVLFIISEVIHFLLLAWVAGSNTPIGMTIRWVTLSSVGVLLVFSLISIVANPETANWFQRHAFYLGEAAGFSGIASVPVLLAWL